MDFHIFGKMEPVNIYTMKYRPRKFEYEVQSLYQETIKFAARKHQEAGQEVPGTGLPYVVHLSNVAMEILMAAPRTEGFDLAFAIRVALLHDTIEDTGTTFQELGEKFGEEVADAVAALSKDVRLPKDQQIIDSISRIRKLPGEVWAVKLADRITNLQPAPPDWSTEKKARYLDESRVILRELGEGNPYLAGRLEAMMVTYL
jgi:guanosine-3',5'-bis(diphosphate) 3'-pyrophosphohydrolase